MKILNGLELVGFIKERQAKQVRNLRQSHKVLPTLAIVRTSDAPVISMYVSLKQQYGDDILIDVQDHVVHDDELLTVIDRLNDDTGVHGIIVQLPLANPDRTDEVLARVRADKDVDGLAPTTRYDAATPTAINWLLTGYGIDIHAGPVAVVGQGRLVGTPLSKMWKESGVDVRAFDETTGLDLLKKCPVIVTATGQPGLITNDHVQIGAVVVDAGTASDNGKVVGDVAPEVRLRDDVTMTPEKGGVGPLTVAALFDNVITAARRTVEKT